MTEGAYSTELSKGQAAFDEIQALLGIWHPDMPLEEIRQRTVREGILGTATATRADDLVVRVFARRLLTDNERPARILQGLMKRNANTDLFKQISLIFTARQHPILRDFLSQVYWPAYISGEASLTRQDAEKFIHQSFARGRIATTWSPTMVIRTARYLLGTAYEFGLLGENFASSRQIIPYRMLDLTALFLAWEHHEKGFSDTSLLKSEDWKLFAFETTDIIRCLERLTVQQHMIMQYSGEILNLTWNYANEEAFLDGISRS